MMRKATGKIKAKLGRRRIFESLCPERIRLPAHIDYRTSFMYSLTVTKRYPLPLSAAINSGNCAVVVVSS